VPHAPTLAEVVAVLDDLYDPRTAEPWDAVGLVCGEPQAPVRRIALAIDPVAAVAEEAVAWGADLLLTHHPLFLTAVHGIAATTAKGRLVHGLVTRGVALHVAHTNADTAFPGVSDALARTLGLTDVRPLVPRPAEPLDKIVTFVPHADTDRVVDALAAAGAGGIGAYTRCAWTAAGVGTFRPGDGARPAIGRVGEVERVPETRVEMVLPRTCRTAVLAALRTAHPYEQPAYDVLELASEDARGDAARGTGRVGTLAEPTTLEAFVAHAAEALPATAGGLRAAGEPRRTVRTAAVCGGAGDGYLDAARSAGADVYLTADLRHHRASEAIAEGGPALVDAAHWATEWPWLDEAAGLLTGSLAARGTTVETHVSRIVTDPWTAHTGQAPLTAPTPGGMS
jgi:dinuclear metal center YbgI/SA1388 family protein